MALEHVGFLTAIDLQQILTDAGHSLWNDNSESDGDWPSLCPTPDQVFNVAVRADFTLKLPYRRDYFVVDHKSSSQLSDNGEDHPFLSFVEHKLSADKLPGGCISFLNGPISWLAAQIAPETGFLFWAESRHEPRGLPVAWYMSHNSLSELINPTVLGYITDLVAMKAACFQSHFFELLYESARSSYYDEVLRDFFVADLTAKRVFTIHHHDRVECIIPSHDLREMHLRRLRSQPSGIVEMSDYFDPEYDDDDDSE